MTTDPSDIRCPAGPEALADLLNDDLLRLEPGERLWKLYCFRAAQGRSTQLRHRIYTKLKTDGRLALVTFVLHTPVAERSTRSNIARVADLPIDALDRIIQAIVAQTHCATDEFEALDLSDIPTLEQQWEQMVDR